MRSLVLGVALSLLVGAFTGCSGEKAKVSTGSLVANLIVAPGIDETAISYEITGNGIDLTGTIPVTSNPVTASIAGIPVGTAYTIKLSTADGLCSGSSPFDVTAGQTTNVSVQIQCANTPQQGEVDVSGNFVLCPTISSAIAAPATVNVGGTIQVNANAQNLSGGTLTYAWTATAGSFADPTAAGTAYMCSAAGAQTLTIKASNGTCSDSLSMNVTCAGAGPTCGNGVVDTGETCDTAIPAGQTGACPTSCTTTDPCNPMTLQNAGTCTAACVSTPITSCISGDGCCPSACTHATDSDCPVQNLCGNGVVDAGETCDTAIPAGQTGACPTSCTAPDACTTSTLQNAGTCMAACVNAPVAPCCGNGVVETGETCDTAIPAGQTGACPTSCTAPDTCTTSTLQNAHTCTAACVNTPITACISGDGCCPATCTHATDSDCPVQNLCGNGVVDAGETCDTAIPAGQTGACPTSCTTTDPCNPMTLENAGTCTAQCVGAPITACVGGDSCCPSGCTHANDSDCSVSQTQVTPQAVQLIPVPQFNGVAMDLGGNSYITAAIFTPTQQFTGVSGTINVTSNGGADILVAKYDPVSMKAVWARNYGDSSDQFGSGVAVTADNTVAVFGNFLGSLSSGSINLANTGTAPYDFLIGLDGATGNGKWGKSFNDGLGGAIVAVAANPALNLIAICGYTNQAATDLVPGATFGGGTDIVIGMFKSDGTLVWSRQIGAAGTEECDSLVIDNNGDLYAAGKYNGALDLGLGALPNPSSNFRRWLWVAKMSGAAPGTTLSNAAFYGCASGTCMNGVHTANSLALDSQNKLLVAGSFTNVLDFAPADATKEMTSAGGADAFVAKLDPAAGFARIWAVSMGSTLDDSTQGVAVDSVDDVVAVGYYQGNTTGGATLTDAGASDAFIWKLSGVDGSTQQAVGYGDAQGQTADRVAVNGQGTSNIDLVEIGGVLNGTITFPAPAGSLTATQTSSFLLFANIK